MPIGLKRVVHLVENPAHIGGIPGRVRRTVQAAEGRTIQHLCLAAQSDPAGSLPGAMCAEDDEANVLAFLRACHATDTVVISPNNIFRAFSPPVREQLGRLPIIHMASGQLAFILQDSEVLANPGYIASYKVSRILCLSELDMSLHRQFGIHALTKVKLPVATRQHNTYNPTSDRHPTYVGRIDFHAKGADRLIPIAKLMKQRGLPPLRIFTTDGSNSPDLPAFQAQLTEAGLSDWVKIVYNSTDQQRFYEQASVLLLPSRKESFGNVVLEAFSYGVPVIAPSYAPGPAEIIRDGQDGFLLEEYSAEAVVALLESLTPERLVELSQAGFARHQDYSMEQYLASLEQIAADTVRSFSGKNEISPFPEVKAIQALTRRLNKAKTHLKAMEESASWRLTKPLRILGERLKRTPS